MNTRRVLIQVFLRIQGFDAPKKRLIVSMRGNPKAGWFRASFSGDRTLTLWNGLTSLSQVPPLQTCPIYRGAILIEAFTLLWEGGPAVTPSIRLLLVSDCNCNAVKLVPCMPPKGARYLQTFRAETLEGPRSDQGKTLSRLFSVTRGGGLVPKWRHFLKHPLLQNGPFYKPG